MKQWFIRALAPTISVAGVLVAPALAMGDDDWSSFDRDFEALASAPLALWGEGPALHALVRPSFVSSPNTNGYDDTLGFRLENAQVSVDGEISDKLAYRAELEAAGGTAVLLDAYGSWQSCQYVRVTMGQFRSPLLWESQLSDSDLLFILRTDSGQLFYTRDTGAMLSGSLGAFHWAASVQSGLDALQDQSLFTVRAGFDAIGNGVGPQQGAYGAGTDTKLSFGAGFFDDQSQGGGKEGDVLAADAQFRAGRFSADAMVAKFQEFTDPSFLDRSDSLPWNASASFMVVEEKLEVAGRYQDVDNVRHEKDVTGGVNYYLDGHAVKIQADVSYIFSDDNHIDDTVRFGLAANVKI